MTSVIEMVVPPTGEVIDASRLVRWIVAPGQAFKLGEVLLEIETDKSIIEIPAQEDGVMMEHLVGADEQLSFDTRIARIQVERESGPQLRGAESNSSTKEGPRGSVSSDAQAPHKDRLPGYGSMSAGPLRQRKFATPAARRLAGERGIAIDTVRGTGPGERVIQADLLRALSAAKKQADGAPGRTPSVRTGLREAVVSTSHGEISINLGESPAGRSGPTAVLIHGIFGDITTWASTAQSIYQAGLRVLALDLPCHGKTTSEITTFADIVKSVAEVISSQCTGPVALIGHSFGGAIAARVARKRDPPVQSLLLIAPTGMGTEIDQGFLDGMTYADSNESLLRELTKLTAAGITPSNAYADELRRRIRLRRDRLIDVCRQVSWKGVQQLDVMPDLRALQCPVVVIQGRRDRIIPWRQVLNIPPKAALHLLPDAGHMPQWEATTLTTQIILNTILRQ